jgi:hypothetical protein
MAEIEYTDPARELVDTCRKLHVASSARGDEFLAATFGVNAWSKEFHEIVVAMLDRVESLKPLVGQLGLDSDAVEDANRNLAAIASAFGISSLINPWNAGTGVGAGLLGRENLQPIFMLSAQIRSHVKYAKLNDDLVNELIVETTDLLSWLENHQISEQDFIRQTIIDGVRRFQFRISKLSWLGYGYTIDSLRDVISAYVMLERAVPDLASAPNADAVLRKVMTFMGVAYKKLGLIKDVTEVGDFVLRAYGALYLVKNIPQISGLLAG